MSTSQLQAALVSLIRYPELNRGEAMESFLSQYDLNEKEQWQVRSLATSYYVAKFGRDQRATRFDLSVRGTLPLTGSIVSYRTMARDIYGIRFEPSHENLSVAEMAKAFARFFIENADGIAKEFGCPEYLGDLAKYEFAEYSIKGPDAVKDWKLPQGSLLRADVPLDIVTFRYDMVDIVERLRKLEESSRKTFTAEAKDTIVLFARIPRADGSGAYTASQFEIDSSLRDFLLSQMTGSSAKAVERPSCYTDLVSLGLCQPLQ